MLGPFFPVGFVVFFLSVLFLYVQSNPLYCFLESESKTYLMLYSTVR